MHPRTIVVIATTAAAVVVTLGLRLWRVVNEPWWRAS